MGLEILGPELTRSQSDGPRERRAGRRGPPARSSRPAAPRGGPGPRGKGETSTEQEVHGGRGSWEVLGADAAARPWSPRRSLCRERSRQRFGLRPAGLGEGKAWD